MFDFSLGSESKVSMVKVMPPKEFLNTLFPPDIGAEYQQNDNALDRNQLWDKEKSILLQKVAKLLDSRKQEGRVGETQASPPITQDQPAVHHHQV